MSDAVERLQACISASMITRVQKTSATQLRDDIQDVLAQLAEAQAALAVEPYQALADMTALCRRMTDERDEAHAQLAESKAALLHMEADRDGCLKIMFSSEHGKEIRELQVEVIRLKSQLTESNKLRDSLLDRNSEHMMNEYALRAQLERSPCGHLKAEFVYDETSNGVLLNTGHCAGCKREADAVRSGREEALQLACAKMCVFCGSPDFWKPSELTDRFSYLFDYWHTRINGAGTSSPCSASSIRALAPASQPTVEVKE